MLCQDGDVQYDFCADWTKEYYAEDPKYYLFKNWTNYKPDVNLFPDNGTISGT